MATTLEPKWRLDRRGLELPTRREALRHLREQAELAIKEGDDRGYDVRQVKVRLRNEEGRVFFEGTMQAAAQLIIT